MSNKEEIMRRIQEAGIVVQAQKTVQLTRDEAGNFYEEHKNKAFYGDLCNYMARYAFVFRPFELCMPIIFYLFNTYFASVVPTALL